MKQHEIGEVKRKIQLQVITASKNIAARLYNSTGGCYISLMDARYVAQKIKEARKNANLTQIGLAAACNCSAASVSKWETGLAFPERERWETLEKVLNLPHGWFWNLQATGNVVLPALQIRGQATYTPPANVAPAALPDRSRRVPVVSLVRAGAWTAATATEPNQAEEWIACSARVGPRAFALRVEGDSMEPEFREGEFVIVDPDIEAASGDFVVAALGNDEATLKRYQRDGGRDWLVPLNSRYPTMDMTGTDWRVVGRVMQRLKEY